jgi:hypothetical protein
VERQATQWPKEKGQSTTQKTKDQERTKIYLEGHLVNIMLQQILKVVYPNN